MSAVWHATSRKAREVAHPAVRNPTLRKVRESSGMNVRIQKANTGRTKYLLEYRYVHTPELATTKETSSGIVVGENVA